jgi:dTDP-4-amino-4,6-dideoxygalactose transaminase
LVKNGSSAYDIIEAGYKCNMSDLQATIGLAQLEILDEMNKKRRVLVDYFRAQLKNVNGLSLPGAKD